MIISDINSDNLEIFPKDTQSDPTKTLRSAIELDKLGINFKNVSEEFRPTILKTRYRANSKTLLRVTRVEETPLEISLQKKICQRQELKLGLVLLFI